MKVSRKRRAANGFFYAAVSKNVDSFQEVFMGLNAANSSTNESAVQLVLDRTIRIKTMFVNVHTNTMNADVIFNFRDDGVSVYSITVDASTTGRTYDNSSPVEVASGSLINFSFDFGATTLGGITVAAWAIEWENA